MSEGSEKVRKQGRTPLASAAEAGDIGLVAELLAGVDIDVDGRDYDGSTPLALAAKNGHADVVARLLACGANPNLRDLELVAPLWHAARYGHASIVRLLLESGRLSDVNPRPLNLDEHESETPLAIALKEGHREAAELLARADGIDPYVRMGWPSSGGMSILLLAIRNGHEAAALALLDRCDLGHKDTGSSNDGSSNDGSSNDGSSNDGSYKEGVAEPASKLLVHAAGAGCFEIVWRLLADHGANVNAVYGYSHKEEDVGDVRRSPLMAASSRGHPSVVCLLLDTAGIRPGLVADDGSTALTLAAEGGFVDVVKRLISDARVEVDHKDQQGRTALSHAAGGAHEAVVAELLNMGAVDPDSKDEEAQTPLIWAVNPTNGYGRAEWHLYRGVVQRLLANCRVNVNSRDRFGHTPLSLAASHGDFEIVMAILEHPDTDPENGHIYTPLCCAASSGHVDVVQALLNTGRVDVNAVMAIYNNVTALMTASQYGHEEVVQRLLSTPGIDLDVEDHVGETSLMKAARYGHAQIVKHLLVSGSDPNLRNGKGQTALCLAAVAPDWKRAEDAMRALTAAPGIKIDLADNRGRTPLSLAAEAGRAEYVKILLAINDINPDARDTAGRSPLSWALSSNQFHKRMTDDRKDVVRQLLLRPTVDPNAEDRGRTALLRATLFYNSNEFVEFFLSRTDVDVNRPGRNGRRPLTVAKRTRNTVTVTLLRARGATEDEALSDEALTEALSDEALTDEAPHEYSFLSEGDSEKDVSEEFIYSSRQHQRRRRSTHGSRSGSSLDPDERTLLSRSSRKGLLRDIDREYHLPLGDQQAYVGEWAESTASICRACAAIDLDAAFSNRHTRYTGRVIANLGMVDEAWKNRACPLCRLFAAVRPRGGVQGHTLMSFSVTQSWLCHRTLACWYDLQEPWVDTMVLAVVADSMVRSEGEFCMPAIEAEDVKAILSTGLIGRLGTNCPDKKYSVEIPRLSGSIGESGMRAAREWIATCRQNHSRRCNPRRLATVPHFFLVDCTTRRIMEPKQSAGPPPYVALSYVWGQPPGQPSQSLGGVVEAVIEDAISVTLQLGYGYLWVDRYCIVQTGNEAIKQEQLRHMHTVYANAEVTLVAAAGSDPSAGLLGAPGRPRPKQPGAFLQGHALVCIPPDPSNHINSTSTWATRGWTYQEGLLARRRLYFSEHEMSYECRDMLCREAVRLPPAVEQSMSGPKPRLMESLWMYERDRLSEIARHNDTGLFDLLAAYSTRQLSLPSDALNAMLGILQLLAEDEKKPLFHICGVPILDPDQTLNNNGRGISVALAHDGFINGLCWCLQQPACRRPGFPSWSWTGWQGVVKGMRGEVPRFSFGFGIKVSIVPGNHDGDAVPWDHYYEQLRTADEASKEVWSGQQHALEIMASAATVRFRRGDADENLGEWIGTVCAGDGVWQGGFSLTRKEGDVGKADSLLSSLLQKPWTGIVLGNSTQDAYDKHDTYVLVVQEQEGGQRSGRPAVVHTYCERVGLLKLERCTLVEGMLERRTWRLT